MVYDKLYALMRSHYQYSIEHDFKEKRDNEHLVQHIALGYLRKHESISEKESLLNDFPGLYTSGWKETNARCDYDVPLAEFQAARKRGLQGRLERML